MIEEIYLTRVVLLADDPRPLFVTRDSDDETGILSDVCEIWLERPGATRALNGKGAMWMPTHKSHAGLMGRYTVEAIKKWIGNACPATDGECVVVS